MSCCKYKDTGSYNDVYRYDFILISEISQLHTRIIIRDKDRKQGRVLHSDKTIIQKCHSPTCIYHHYFKAYRQKNNRT